MQARVVLTPMNVPTNGIEQGVAIANSNNWTEAGITWNNQPGGGERFATWIPGTSAPVSFDVTPQVMAALAADKQLSVQLFSIGTNSVDYASRENSNPTNTPQLVLALVPLPQFTNAVYVGGGFAFAGTGPAGQPYRVFTTTNLLLPFTNWTAISTGTFSGGVFSYTNAQATNQRQQFYRLISP